MNLEWQSVSTKTVKYRKLNAISIDSFKIDVAHSDLYTSPCYDIEGMVTQYNQVLLSLVDKYAPIKQVQLKKKHAVPWYNGEINKGKRLRRKLERRWRKSKQACDLVLFKQQCNVVNKL